MTKATWLKVTLSIALTIMLTSLLRFSSWFVSITNSAETNLIHTLDVFYGFSIRAMYFIIAGAVLFLVLLILQIIRGFGRKKRDKEWEEWGSK